VEKTENEKEEKRLFFGAAVSAPWSKTLPEGRIIHEESRHITLAFLGQISFPEFKPVLSSFPLPTFHFGPIGKCDKILFIPERHPRCAALHVEWLEKNEPLNNYYQSIRKWMQEKNLAIDKHNELLSHITLARWPFDRNDWKEAFQELPVIITGIHLYESVGNLTYKPLWSHPLVFPFDEIDHTADIAFHIKAEDMKQLHLHAQFALSFKFPPFISYISKELSDSLDEIIIDLNETIAKADAEIGCPFKAVSFHGNIEKDENNILHWEMIVDV
jgi:2'-5' RNA ligase